MWERLLVDPSDRRHGIGSEVVGTVCELLRHGGCSEVRVLADNSAAFWVDLGFDVKDSEALGGVLWSLGQVASGEVVKALRLPRARRAAVQRVFSRVNGALSVPAGIALFALGLRGRHLRGTRLGNLALSRGQYWLVLAL